jgi:hypothetical protein
MSISIEFPLRLGRGLNSREHYMARAKRVKSERWETWYALRTSGADKPHLPCVVTITRVSPRGQLDDDGAVGACKGVRDEIAAWLGVDDKHSDIVRYVCKQARGPWGTRIEMEEKGEVKTL